MKHKDIILLLTSIFIVVVAWIGFSIYHNLATSTTPEILEKEALPIKSSFDEPTIKRLKERKQVSPLYQFDNPLSTPTAPDLSPTIIPSPPASPSPTVESLTPTASPGGEITQ